MVADFAFVVDRRQMYTVSLMELILFKHDRFDTMDVKPLITKSSKFLQKVVGAIGISMRFGLLDGIAKP